MIVRHKKNMCSTKSEIHKNTSVRRNTHAQAHTTREEGGGRMEGEDEIDGRRTKEELRKTLGRIRRNS